MTNNNDFDKYTKSIDAQIRTFIESRAITKIIEQMHESIDDEIRSNFTPPSMMGFDDDYDEEFIDRIQVRIMKSYFNIK